jgi:hypothetical protein
MTVNGPPERPYYRCSAAKNRGTCDRKKNVLVALVQTLVLDTIRARMDECADEVLAICAEEIRAWQSERPSRAGDLERAIKKGASAIQNCLAAIEDGYSKHLGVRLKKLEADQTLAEAALARLQAEAPVLPSPQLLRDASARCGASSTSCRSRGPRATAQRHRRDPMRD